MIAVPRTGQFFYPHPFVFFEFYDFQVEMYITQMGHFCWLILFEKFHVGLFKWA